jgi:hypothetical protein
MGERYGRAKRARSDRWVGLLLVVRSDGDFSDCSDSRNHTRNEERFSSVVGRASQCESSSGGLSIGGLGGLRRCGERERIPLEGQPEGCADSENHC